MKKIIFLLLVGFVCLSSNAQHTFTALIKDAETGETLVGATAFVEKLEKGSTTDLDGKLTITDIPTGTYDIEFSYVGYEEFQKTYTFPLAAEENQIIELAHLELETITITTTRSSRQIDDIPTRIEVINAEELAEKAIMNSSNIAMILRESTGIQMQQTSASSANQSIRIQGLDGRYTQLLKDGFPLFGGFSSGLSIMQIPPLDLAQVEVIKGSSSTLYGGGAIAGLVNLVTKRPEEDPELTFMFSQTQALGSTLNGFYSQQYGKAGMTIYTSGHYQKAYDNNQDEFSDLPDTKTFTFNPSFFYDFNETTKVRVGLLSTFEDRVGGDMDLLDNGEAIDNHIFSETNLSTRLASQIQLDKEFGSNKFFTFKNSLSYFDRSLTLPNYKFEGNQQASFTEATLRFEQPKNSWLIGTNFITDKFEETTTQTPRDYQNNTIGVFGQNTWQTTNKLSFESGLRLDYHNNYGVFVLPRLAVLANVNQHWTARLGGGLGYKTPTIFTEETESLGYQGIQPIDVAAVEAEKSIGGNVDLNYKTILFDKVSFSINNLLFYTRVTKPLILLPIADSGDRLFRNADGFSDSRGLETNMKFGYQDFKLFMNYALIDARLQYEGLNRAKPLTPKHNIGTVLMYETEKWRVGYEVYYTGKQTLSNNQEVQDYWTMGLMVLRNIGHTDFYINFENFTDTRQSRYQSMFTESSTHSKPKFAQIWAPTDGFIFTIGLKYHVFGKEEEHD